VILSGKYRRSQELVEMFRGDAQEPQALQILSEVAVVRNGSHAETRRAPMRSPSEGGGFNNNGTNGD
jgi:hypothetical protein